MDLTLNLSSSSSSSDDTYGGKYAKFVKVVQDDVDGIPFRKLNVFLDSPRTAPLRLVQ
jgi:hypothetical protein